MLDAELIRKVKDIDLLDYLQSNGYRLLKSGPHEYRLEEHDSLVISNNKWHWKSRDIGGNPLDFLIKYEGKSFYDAVMILNNRPLDLNRHRREAVVSYRAYDYEKKSEKLQLPEKSPTMSRVFAYLSKSRGIEREIISKLAYDGVLYESVRHNCVFLGKDLKGEVRFACERGTLTEKPYKRDCPGSNKKFGFTMGDEKSTRLYVFESAIDAMSHASILKFDSLDWQKDYRLSLGGVEDLSLMQLLNDRPHIKHVTLCLDNDPAGNQASLKISDKLEQMGYKVDREPPCNKDYNEDLLQIQRTIQKVLERGL